MRLTYKYRLFPTASQRTAMWRSLNACRWVYNKVLETRKEAWEQRRESVSHYDTIKMLPDWKQEHPSLNDAYSQSLQNTCTRVDLAFQAFFRRVKAGQGPGYPRFRGRGRYDSFTYPQSGFKILDDGRLHLSKIGDVKVKLHRPIEGRVKTLTIRRDALGNWYACFCCEVDPQPLSPSPKIVGVDVGLTYFATFSTGERIANPRFFHRDERVLAKAQCRLSRATTGASEHRKCKRVVQHIHQRTANRRKDFLHKLSHRLVNGFQLIALEDLDIQDMQIGNFRGINKSIGDAAWDQFIRYTTYKAVEAGRSVIKVDPCNTSQICSYCGRIVKKVLSYRVHSCPHCGLEIDRDLNASLNILARGLACMGSIPRSSPLRWREQPHVP